MRDSRIKVYWVAPITGNVAGSNYTAYTDSSINGELLRVDTFSNFTGSIVIKTSGQNIPFLNGTVTSGTSKWESFPLSNTTGSFVTNSTLFIGVSGVSSGTSVTIGPVQILYR